MNELELIREQLRRETQHVGEIVRILACRPAERASSHEAELREACADYLQFALTRLDPQLQIEAMAKLQAARASATSKAFASAASNTWHSLTELFERCWASRAHRIEAEVGHDRSVARWRAAAPMDADSILEERARYARVQSLVQE